MGSLRSSPCLPALPPSPHLTPPACQEQQRQAQRGPRLGGGRKRAAWLQAEGMPPLPPRRLGSGRGLPITASIRPGRPAACGNERRSERSPLAPGKLQIYNFPELN